MGRINSRKKNTGMWEGKYPGDGLFYQHKLEMEDYGIDKNWGFVKLGDKWPDAVANRCRELCQRQWERR